MRRDAAWPASLAGRSYRGRRMPSGGWRIDARGGALPAATFVLAGGRRHRAGLRDTNNQRP